MVDGVLEEILRRGIEVTLLIDLDGNYRARVMWPGRMFPDVVVSRTLEGVLGLVSECFGSANEPLAERNS